ncbi:unnamed protein product [Cunninghamella blakesleeana]
MNNIHSLPTELTWNVFQRLSQRDLMNGLGVNGMWYTSIMQFRIYQATIEFCTVNQLKRFITTSNESMSFDLCKIILHFPIDNHIQLVSTLIRLSPRLQQIKTENDGDPYPFSIIKTPTPISFNHVNFWYRNSFIININEANARRRQLKTLDYSLGSHLPFNSSICLQSIGTMKSRLTRNFIQVVIDFYSKVLLMPTFIHLISLRIALKGPESDPDRYEYEMDERILQSINQSCPNLESLYLFDYFINISDEYNTRLFDNNNNGIDGIQGLKSFSITGAIFDMRCCSLFNLMYPQLESFQYIYSYEKVNDYDSQYLQLAFRDMITQFTSLKRLSLRSISYDDTDLCKYWPDYSFIEFLNNHPDRLVSLDYPDCLYPIVSSSTGGDRIYYNNNNNIISNGLFFNRLFSLVMRPKQLIETVMNFLLHNDNKLTISESIKELKIYDTKRTDNNRLYLIDWLVLFPALDTFKIDNQVLVDSDNSDDVDGDKLNGHYIYNGSSKALHQMIDTRKQQDGIGYNKTGLYKLKTLELNNVKIKYINEMTSLFANFSKLSQLILRHIHYSHIGWYATSDLPRTITSISLDMSHLSLAYLLVTDVRIYSWQGNFCYLEKLVKKIILFERTTGKKSNCNYDPPSGASDSYYRDLSRCHPNDTFTLTLSCHDVDQFIFH